MVFRFGTFAFDDRTTLLTRADRPVALEPQPGRALALLLARAGEVVSREELRAHLWGGDTHVDFDRGLAYCIGELRAALGDSADNPRFVQTLPRRGFRFIAPVDVTTADPLAPQAVAPAPAVVPAAPPPVLLWRAKRVSSLAAAVLAAAIAAGWFMMRRPPSPDRSRPIVAVAVFENESGDPANERVVAGLSDVIVERLTALGPSRLGINGNATILRRPRDARDTRAVARETGASFLVSGQLQSRDGRLSLLMQLIRLDDGTHVWVDRIGRPAGDALDTLDGDVARKIEAAVRDLVLKENHAVHNTSARPDILTPRRNQQMRGDFYPDAFLAGARFRAWSICRS
jgi:DNA-binding winged helix-turn-helix (wHTH) protein/TolB-like protein